MVPVHEADGEEVCKQVGLKVDVGEIMVIIPQVVEVHLLVRRPREPPELFVKAIELLFPNLLW